MSSRPYSCRRKKGFASFLGGIILLLNSLTEVKCLLCAESPSIFKKGVYYHRGQVDRPHRICEDEEEQEKRVAFFRGQPSTSQLTTANEVVDWNDHAHQRVQSDLQQARFAVTYPDELDELFLVKNAYLIQDRIQYLNSIVVPASKIRVIKQGALDTIHV
jgi:hypothetical protein